MIETNNLHLLLVKRSHLETFTIRNLLQKYLAPTLARLGDGKLRNPILLRSQIYSEKK
jgi:hypothetical protein